MGMFDNIKNFFNRGSQTQPQSPITRSDDPYKKSYLITQIKNTIEQIKKIHSFDRSVMNLSFSFYSDLERKSLDELMEIYDNFNSRLNSLTKESQKTNPQNEALQKALWTGVPMKGQTQEDLRRAQDRDR